MAANIQFLRSTVPHLRPHPHDLSLGTPMINVNDTDPGLYFRSSDGNLLKVGPSHVGPNPPNLLPPGGANHSLCIGEQWLDTSNSERPRLLTWNGAIWQETLSVDNLVFVQETAPTGDRVVGSALWFKPSTRELFLRENDEWIDIQRAPFTPETGVQYGKNGEFNADPRFLYDDTLNQLTLGSILFPTGEVFTGSAGNDTEIQFRLNGEFSSSPELTYSPSGKILTVLGNVQLGNPVALPVQSITLSGDITLDGPVEVSGAFTAKSTSALEGDTTIGTSSLTNLEVHSISTFNNNVTVGTSAGDILTSVGITRLNGRVEIGLDDTTELIVNSRSFIEADCELGNNATLSQWYIERLSNSEITNPQIGDVLVHGPGNKWYNEKPGQGPYNYLVEEAPKDGQYYLRKDGAWINDDVNGGSTWNTLTELKCERSNGNDVDPLIQLTRTGLDAGVDEVKITGLSGIEVLRVSDTELTIDATTGVNGIGFWMETIGGELQTKASGQSVVPNGSASLGTSGQRWSNIYTQDLHLSNEKADSGNSVDGTWGDWTLQEGKNDIYMLNNRTGQKFKMALIPV